MTDALDHEMPCAQTGLGGRSEFFDGREMFMVHRAFRREFGLAPGLVRRVDVGDTVRCRTVFGHLRFIATALHDHHGLW